MVELMEHQKDALTRLKTGSILCGDTGSGKTITALAYYLEKESPKPLYVITTAKKRDGLDWEREALKFALGKSSEATIGGILHVDSWNNITKYEEIKDAFFILDEQRLVGAGAWVKSFLKIAKANNWILLSATPGDTWLDYIPVFVANGFYRNRSEFKLQHVVYRQFANFPKVERYTSVGRLERLRNAILVEMPYTFATTRNFNYLPVDYNVDDYDLVWKRRWNLYEERPLKDVGEQFRVARRVLYSDSSRIEKVAALLDRHPRLIVFYNFNFELDILRSLDWGGPTAEWNGHKHEQIPDGDSWLYLVQYRSGSEGWNCTSTDAMCFYSLPYSYRDFHQSQGRIDRLDTKFTELWYYVLTGETKLEKGILRSLKAKRDFNERAFVAPYVKKKL